MSAASTTVLGTGLMGTALARCLLADGRPVTVWNRTPERAAPLVQEGAVPAGSVAEAVTASGTTIACVRGAGDLLELMTGLPGDLDLSGRTLVDLSSGDGATARALDAFMQARGGAFLTGSVLVTPVAIGTPDGVVHYAGSAAAWAAVGEELAALAPQGSAYLGPDHDLPGTLDVAVTVPVLGVGLASFVEGAAYAAARGVDLDTVLAAADRMLEVLRAGIHDAAASIASGDYRTDQATLDVWRRAATRCRDAVVAEGHPAHLLDGLVAAMDHADAAGYGSRSLAGLHAAVLGVRAPTED
ncbi:NAD(P)-binding domain-containing protein [Blastococcus sp. SYSU D00695]